MLHYFIATVSYTGYLPKAPGTWGSLVAIPLYYVFPLHIYIALIPLLFCMGLYSTYKILKKQDAQHCLNDKDPSYIVIDELYAMMIVLAYCQGSFYDIALSFVLFRVFDILKPWPIRWIDTYCKHGSIARASFGVMIDDALAAFMACACLYIMYEFLLIPVRF